MKNKRIYIILLLFIIIINLLILYKINLIYNLNKIENIHIEKMKDEPIDLNTGLINNEYWNISSDGTNPTETREGINNAIEYAYNNKIETIKLKKGTYLIDLHVVDGRNVGIILKSNLKFDLNGSKIVLQSNDKKGYSILSIWDLHNISICNGTIVGERYEHIYDSNSTHEWGMGINIRGGNNVQIFNMEIYNTTGDGIFIEDAIKIISQNISISNCNIYNNRRQGISIISAENVKIYNNEIHDINGTSPYACIDLEKSYNYQEIKNIFIFHNKFYNARSHDAVKVYSRSENIYINNNEAYGNFRFNAENNKGNDTIYIEDNIVLETLQNTYDELNTEITNNFKDMKLKNAILELVGKTSEDFIYESDIAKIASDGVPG